MELTPRRRRVISTLLALALAVESVSAVAAAAVTATASPAGPHALAATSPDGRVLAEAVTASRAGDPAIAPPTPAPTPTLASPAATPTPSVAPAPATTPRPAAHPTTKASPATPKPAVARSATARSAATHDFAGRNHVWIPSLGVDRSVSSFACTRTRPPDAYVYRWGCAGTNNVYLLGHAYGVFQPLHDAYLDGRLRAGMRVWYADGGGAVHQYSVAWWRLTRPTTDASWAWAPQSVPSMTLQTCMGAHSEYRLMVRLVEVSG